jgi:hypothetical protein
MSEANPALPTRGGVFSIKRWQQVFVGRFLMAEVKK